MMKLRSLLINWCDIFWSLMNAVTFSWGFDDGMRLKSVVVKSSSSAIPVVGILACFGFTIYSSVFPTYFPYRMIFEGFFRILSSCILDRWSFHLSLYITACCVVARTIKSAVNCLLEWLSTVIIMLGHVHQ